MPMPGTQPTGRRKAPPDDRLRVTRDLHYMRSPYMRSLSRITLRSIRATKNPWGGAKGALSAMPTIDPLNRPALTKSRPHRNTGDRRCFVAGGGRNADEAQKCATFTLQRPLRPVARSVENKIVAIVLVLPEPFAVLALMNRGIEFGDREKPLLEDKSSAIA